LTPQDWKERRGTQISKLWLTNCLSSLNVICCQPCLGIPLAS
jgi:hypothetical protein